ncbi:hypothetical protein M407DRAFT_27543 [Tulasnella calospora MUT 4182]|uniref:Protein kinase domain-containing protein n=1 Tax=Tulasnella calospora MUT 4182 TaxID=1051891 RepID=A0A0C3LNL5_9AGAM|nr:hypothetical protein M407DRAFT_27543 [Tulasnella calospora MUT 4182]
MWELPERVSLIKDAAAGLDYLHSQEPPVCHGDLKSLNILVDSNYRAVITDFGSARIKRTTSQKHPKTPELQQARGSGVSRSEGVTNILSSNNQTTMTGPGWTLRWAAPELMHEADPDLPSDIWSFGWVCWEVITDNYPFPDVRGPGQIVLNIVCGNLPVIHQHTLLAQIVPLCSLIKDCWKLNPMRRPTACDALKTLQWIPSTRPSPVSANTPKVRSAELLWQLGRILFFQAQERDAVLHLEKSLNASLSAADLPLHASCLVHCGDAARHHSRYEEAEHFYNKALTLYEELGSAVGKAYVKLAVGDLRRTQGNLDEAEKYLRKAQEEGHRRGYPLLEADALFGLGATYRLQKPPMVDAARECFLKSLYLYRVLGDERGTANSLDGLGLVYGAEKKFVRAMKMFKGEWKISLKIGCSLTRAHALCGLGLVHANCGQSPKARERLEEAAKLYKALDQLTCEATTLAFLDALQESETARKLYSKSR